MIAEEVADLIDCGMEPPPSLTDRRYSGRFVVRTSAELHARLMVDAGLIVMVSFISPFRSERRMARGLVEAGEFIEVFVDAPLAQAEARDVKGLYKKARRGELKNFTGIDSPYEAPETPEIRLNTAHTSAEEAAVQVVRYLRAHGIVDVSEDLES